MTLTNLRTLTFFVIALLIHESGEAQRFIGFSGGVGQASFFNFSKQKDYNAHYGLQNGFSFSSFYERKEDASSNFRIELQYKQQQAHLMIDNNAGHGSFYKDIDYTIQNLNLNLLYAFRLLDKQKVKIRFVAGPSVAYTLSTQAKGSGWEYHYITQTDINGNPVQLLTTQNWQKDEHSSKDLRALNIGIDSGFDIMVPLSESIDFLLQNKYNMYITNATTMKELRHTSLFTGCIQLGIRVALGE